MLKNQTKRGLKVTSIIYVVIYWLFSSIAFADSGKLTVYTVNYPLQFFAQRIGGKHVNVEFPAPRNQDPAFWIPDTKIIGEFQKADLILLNGAGYAKWIKKVSLPRSRLLNTSQNFKDNYIYSAGNVTHKHGLGGDHSHTGTAFTTWLDLTQAIEQANAILKALSRLRGEFKPYFEKNFINLQMELHEFDDQIKTTLVNAPKKPLIASHPVYQYFSRAYELDLVSVWWEPEQLPTKAQWLELEKMLKNRRANWMLWEAEPNPKSVKMLEELGINSIVFEPCANVPEQGDFLSVMRGNIENLKRLVADE